jgi:hypothetical protein
MASQHLSPRRRDILRPSTRIDARAERASRSADSALTAGLLITISRLDGELAQLRRQASLMTPTAVAGLLGVSVHSIVRWTDCGQLPCVVLPGGERRYTPQSVDALLTLCQRSSPQVAS